MDSLNNALSAINTMQSGTSRPSGAALEQWLDVTSASSPTIKFFDGSDDISFATIIILQTQLNFRFNSSRRISFRYYSTIRWSIDVMEMLLAMVLIIIKF